MASNVPPLVPLPQSSPASTDPLWALIPGGDVLQGLLALVRSLVGDIGSAVQDVQAAHPFQLAASILDSIQMAPQALLLLKGPTWDQILSFLPSQFYSELLKGGLGVDPSAFGDTGKAGVKTVDTMLGFALACDLIGAAVEAAGIAELGGRWAPAIARLFQEFLSEVGINWAMGMEVERGFEAAVGTSIEEAIHAQKRPIAPEWPIIRAMLKQRIVDEPTLRERFAAFGFADHWIDKLLALTDVPLPVGDLQNLYLHEIISTGDIDNGLRALGFNDQQRAWLQELYIDKAETETSRAYAATARQLYANYLIPEADYVAILQAANYPSRMIADDLAAIKLEHDTGRLNLSMAAIKAEYVRGNHDANQATTELLRTGLTPDAITELIHTWDLPAQKHEHGMSASKVLSYFVSGLMTEADARARLLDTGLKPADVDFLLANPTAKPGVRVRPRTPGFIVTAYVDGAVAQDQLSALFTSAGVAPDDLDKWLAIATYRYAHRKPTSATGKPLTDSDIREAFKNGIFDPHTAISGLVANGWSTENATVLLEITNKGQPLTPPAGPFATLQEAIAFLQGLGYAIIGPPDPRIGAAEGMIIAAGYSYIQPSTPGEVVGSGTGGTPIGPVLGP